MVSAYHRQRILHASPRQKRDRGRGWLDAALSGARIALLIALLAPTGCDAVQVVEGSETHVSVRYDGMMNGLDQATLLAQKACAAHGKTANLRKTYYEGLGAGERFAFFDCV